MAVKKVSIDALAAGIDKPWTPLDVVEIDDFVLRMAVFQGEYPWHQHTGEDEFFLIYSGHCTVETKDGAVELGPGEGVLVPRGLSHRPRSDAGAVGLMIEPKSLVSRGD